MRLFGNARRLLAPFLFLTAFPVTAQSLKDLQAQFDRESDSIRKAKLLIKLGDAEFDETRRAGKAGDSNTVDATLEKYRDNVKAAVEALKNQHRDAEKHSNGFRQLEMHVHKGLREVEEAIIAAPEPYRPPLKIVRQDLISLDDELIKLLFPHRPGEQPAASPTEKQP